MITHIENLKNMKITNVQCSRGQPHPGVVLSEDQIKKLFPKNKKVQIEIVSQKDFENLSMGVQKTMEITIKRFLAMMETDDTQNETILAMGGDHYTSVGTILGSLMIHGSKLRVVYMDAHGDIHNRKTSPSGNIHGMVLRDLMEHSIQGIPRLKSSQLLYVGIRDLEKEEWDFIHKKRIKYIPAVAFREDNPIISRTLLDFIGDNPVHVSLDVDVLDPAIMPSTGTCAPEGLTLKQLENTLNICRPDFLDIVEYNPQIGSTQKKQISLRTMKKIVSWL